MSLTNKYIEATGSVFQGGPGAPDQTSDISHVCLVNESPVLWSTYCMPRLGRTLGVYYFIQSYQQHFDNGTIITHILQMKQLRPK